MPRVDLDSEALPTRLTAREQWVCWCEAKRDGKLTKLPVDPDSGELASTTDDRTWTTFAQARSAAEERSDIAGLGFVFTAVDPFVGVDLDDCRDPETGDLSEEARQLIERLDSYAEVSPSGTGVHVLIEGELPADRRRTGDVEMYDDARYFTMTGAHLSLTPRRIAERTDELAAVHADVIADDPVDSDGDGRHKDPDSPPETPGSSTETSGAEHTGDATTTLDDETLIERAREAANGQKFQRLWRGDTGGYPSQSEADMALCCLLAFWTGGDAQQIDRLFRKSGLMRAKWDEVHYADGTTYGERTIERARRVTTETYDPNTSDTPMTATAAAAATAAASSETTTPADSDVAADSATRVAHLEEQTQLLRDRITTMEATVKEQEATLADLRAERRALQQLLALGMASESATEDAAVSESTADAGPSVWERFRRLMFE